jgi:7-cyano-7-deazaguanine synthase in queuosine biosynthesis
LRTSTILNSYGFNTPTKITYVPKNDNSEQAFFPTESIVVRELRELSTSLFLVDQYHPNTNQLEFETSNKELWIDILPKFEAIYEFLTSNPINIAVVQKSKESKVKYQTTFKEPNLRLGNSSICSFSGGADSTAGIVELLKNEPNPVMHHCLTGNRVYGRVKKLHSETTLSNSHLFLTDARQFHKIGYSDLRNFVFLIDTFIVAHALGINHMVYPENGPLILNPRMSNFKDPTKNSHPFLICTLETIFKNLTEGSFSINCIFKDKTKCEVMAPLLKDNLIDMTNSCFIIQGQRGMCGNCFACFVRRFSLLAFKYYEPCIYQSDPFLASCRLETTHETIKDLHDSILFLFNIITGREEIGSSMIDIPNGFFQNPTKLFENFAAEMFIGFKNYFEMNKEAQLSALARFTKSLLEKINQSLLSSREEDLARLLC